MFPEAELRGSHHVRIVELHTVYDTRRLQLLSVDTLFGRYSTNCFIITFGAFQNLRNNTSQFEEDGSSRARSISTQIVN